MHISLIKQSYSICALHEYYQVVKSLNNFWHAAVITLPSPNPAAAREGPPPRCGSESDIRSLALAFEV